MDLSELIESIDILDYISQYTEFTEKNGEYWALSPFKDEKTPSFSVRRETHSFYDFSSGIGGNVLTFVRYYDKCGYAEAIEKLKKFSGVDAKTTIHRKWSITEVAKRFSPPKQTPKQVKRTTVLSEDYITRYEKRADKLAVWEQEGISQASLNKFQVRYDSFSDRLVYPIRDLDGKIVNIGGRILDKDWKVKGLRKYTYFHGWNGGMQVIYGLFENIEEIQQRQEVILFEGAKSVILADTWGIHNTGAILTSHLNQSQMKLLIGLGCRVVFALDKDVSIRSDHNIKRLKQFVNTEYIWDDAGLLGEKDSPVDKGPDVWKKLYERRLSWR